MKLAFLLDRELKGKIIFYNFVPYKNGPYSFEVDRDLKLFNKRRWIELDDKLVRLSQSFSKVFFVEGWEQKWSQVIYRFAELGEKELLEFIYKNYPFYAKNSVLGERNLGDNSSAPISIYTIGYQGLSMDLFIKELVEKGIKVVMDVRNRPFSYKYGFNKYWLNRFLPEFGIKYINTPDLGIEEEIRETLTGENLWEYYIGELNKKEHLLTSLVKGIEKEPTVLLCYEMSPEDCHRSRLAKRIKQIVDLPIINYRLDKREWIEWIE